MDERSFFGNPEAMERSFLDKSSSLGDFSVNNVIKNLDIETQETTKNQQIQDGIQNVFGISDQFPSPVLFDPEAY